MTIPLKLFFSLKISTFTSKKLKKEINKSFSFIIFCRMVFFGGIFSLKILFFHMFQLEAHVRLPCGRRDRVITRCPLVIRVNSVCINLKVCYLVVNFKSTILRTNTSTQEKLKVVKIWRTPIRITWELKINSPLHYYDGHTIFFLVE